MAHLPLGRWGVLGFISGIIVLPFWLCAYFLQIPRLYGYGALLVLALLIGHVLGSGRTGLIGAGGAIMGIGIVMLVRFIRAYPLPPTTEAATNGNP